MNQSMLAVPQTVAPPLDLYGPVSADLEEVERILSQTLKSRYAQVQPVVDHVRHYRGKRLRPVLLLLTARACGKPTPAHHVLGAVVEMIHTATLVHDDVLDGASVRRHTPTVNAGWGVHNAVLLGDYLFTHAFHLASTLDDVRACRLIGKATNRVCEGELCQGLERGNLDLTESDYFDMIDGKTAELLACACHLGLCSAARRRRWCRRWRDSAATSAWPSRSRTTCSTWWATSRRRANRWAPTWNSRR